MAGIEGLRIADYVDAGAAFLRTKSVRSKLCSVGGFMLRAGGARIYFAGDTAYGSFFRDVRLRLGSIDLALESLQKALDLQPNLRVRAQHDHDLNPLRNDPDFDRLIFSHAS